MTDETSLPSDDSVALFPSAASDAPPTPDADCAFPGCQEPRAAATSKGRRTRFCERHADKRHRDADTKRAQRSGSASGAESGTTVPARADVRRAAQSLETLYTLAGVGLGLMGFDHGAAYLSDDDVLAMQRERNIQALNNAPGLVKSLNRTAEIGGTAGFFIAQGTFLVPVLLSIRGELSRRAATKEENERIATVG